MNTQSFVNEETFVISDHHFDHNKVGIFEPIRFEHAKAFGHTDLNKFLIERHNDTVLPSDNILFLGDFAFKAIEYYSNILHGNKIIVLGNHDRKAPLYRNYGWKVFDGIHIDHGLNNSFVYIDKDSSLLSGLVKEVCGKKILFSHYPVFNDNEYDRKNKKIDERVMVLEHVYKELGCNLNIHGHLHSGVSSFKDSINACSEKINGTPVKLKVLIKGFKNPLREFSVF